MGVLWDLIFKEVLNVSEVTMPVNPEDLSNDFVAVVNAIIAQLGARVVWDAGNQQILCTILHQVYHYMSNEAFLQFCALLVIPDPNTLEELTLEELTSNDVVLALAVRHALGID